MAKTHMNMKLTDPERTIIVNALTRAAFQYDKDAERVSELAQYGMTIKEPAEDLAGQFRQHATDARQLRDKITFLWDHLQF
jgi:hypothetical protein